MKELDPNQGCAADVPGNVDVPQMHERPTDSPIDELNLHGTGP